MEDCDCKTVRKIYKEEFDFSKGVGENVFEFEDIFKNIKNYYQNYEGEENDDEDLLLDSLVPKKNNNDLDFINELFNIIEDEKLGKEIEEEKKEEEENISINLNNNIKEKKIKYIKDYLKKLKDGY